MKQVSVVQVGLGTVGGVMLEQMLDQHDRWQQEFGLDIRIAAVAGRSGAMLGPVDAGGTVQSLAPDVIRAMVEGRRGRIASDVATVPLTEAIARIAPAGPTVVVDAASGEQTVAALVTALEAGAGAVLSNKAPLALPLADPRGGCLWDAARAGTLRYEATCGAGLPVISTLKGLLDAGDRVLEVTGCLSGTLGAIFSMVASGESFSEAVREAKTKGYTEPDPRDDLSGLDVARKALILARTMGLPLDLTDIDIHSLVPRELESVSVDDFLERVGIEDAEITASARQAQADGAALKYVAQVTPSARPVATVGLQELPRTTMLGALQGPENIVSFRTERYDRYPLVVSGPGAGAAVTAAGMVVDLLALADRFG
ncbi:MAG: homoserine dehydrogenase [Thermomicrobiales bacterium]